jgi:hypothetical protein
MILLALSLLIAVETHVLPQPVVDAATPAPATAPKGSLEPPSIPPRTALGASALPPDPPEFTPYARTTRMRRIAQGMLATILIGSGATVLVHTHAAVGDVAGICAIGLGVSTAYQAACAD